MEAWSEELARRYMFSGESNELGEDVLVLRFDAGLIDGRSEVFGLQDRQTGDFFDPDFSWLDE